METTEEGRPVSTEAEKGRTGTGAESPGLFQRFKETVGLSATKGEAVAIRQETIGSDRLGLERGR